MRVANKTIYDMIKFRLGNVTEELQKANEVVATGKRINSLSDDPVGLTQVLNIKSSLSNIEQIGRNIDLGKSWLTASESSLAQVQNLISDTKALCVQMADAAMSADEREAAAEIVQSTLEEMVSLANTGVGGRYVFAGSKTDAAAFTLSGSNVTYNGDNNPFTVKVGRNSTVQIGQDGQNVFWEQSITIDSSNNKIDFIEYSGASPTGELTATIASGTYTHDELAIAVKNAMEKVSIESGNSINYLVTYDTTTKNFTIRDDGATSGAHLELLWATGTNADTSIAPDIGFNAVDVRDALIGDTSVTGFPITINGGNNTIDFIEDTGSGPTSLTAYIANADYADGAALAAAVEAAMDAESIANGNSIDYEVTYDAVNEKFVIEEDGTDLQKLQILWNTNPSGNSAGSALGFTQDDDHTPPTSNNQVEWGIFETLKDLKNYLETNDVAGVARSIARLDTHFDHISSKISDMGSKMLRMEIKENIFQDIYFTNTERLSKIEDADFTEAIMNLKAKEVAYQAALASSARIMELSLVDYL
ncbi:MAG: flagellar hook-associated protein FlgL [Deltaproteobacteria bacterium]|nr:flagellar hook-associated protein FlgL [Deltaproteobacteria bacterium]